MKIYLNRNGQSDGPYSVEELRQKIYSGEVPRSVYACVDGTGDWQPLDQLLDQPAGAKPPEIASAGGPPLQLRDPKEKKALLWLYVFAVPVWLAVLALVVSSWGLLLVVVALVWVIQAAGEMLFLAYLKTNAVRVSPQQLPEIDRVAQIGCRKLGMACPDVYILQQNVWNAFATKIFSRRVVVLLSGAVDSILLKGDEQQLAWLVGHELGHHWAGHFDFKQKLAKAGGIVIWLGLWHSRRAELTCDRVGLYCAGSLKASQQALLNATVGAQLASRVSPELAMAQWRDHRAEFFVRYRTLYSSYPHLLARLDHLTQAASELHIAN